MHKVSDVIDDGEFVARSHPVAIPAGGVTAIEMHRITWPQMNGFIRQAVEDILDADPVRTDQTESWTMHEEPVPYCAGEKLFCLVRARHSADDFIAVLRAP